MSARPRKAPPRNVSRTFPSGDSAQCAGGGGGGGELQSRTRGRPDVCRTTIEAIPCVCGCVCVCVARTCSCVITSTETAVELRASLQASVTDGGLGNELEREEEKPREKRRRHVQAPRRDASPLRPLHAEPRVRTQARAATCLHTLCAHLGRKTRRRKNKGIKAEEAAGPSCSRRVPPSLRRDKSPSGKDRTWLGSPASPGDKLHTHARRRAAAGPPGRHRSRRGASRPPRAGQPHVRPRRVTRTRPGPLASRPACRELGSHHSRPSRKRKQR